MAADRQREASADGRGPAGSTEAHGPRILALPEGQPDLTPDEIFAAAGSAGAAPSRVSIWRFFRVHGVSVEKAVHPAGRVRSAGGKQIGPPRLRSGLSNHIHQTCPGFRTVRSFSTLPVLSVVPGSRSTTSQGVSATGRCSTPCGTMMNSPGSTICGG